MKTVKYENIALELKPKKSIHPQGNRILFSTTRTNNTITFTGKPRFNKFELVVNETIGNIKYNAIVTCVEKKHFTVNLIKEKS